MVELPQGTVTFLFTDIEGSTELLKRLGHRYHDVLEHHARILRDAASSHGGREVDNQGDSFFFAFARANAALGAAVVAQRALAAHEWPDGAEVRVRMGLHTGEPSVGGERYVGLGVHRAARIGAAGHGGQVLLSNATRELVEGELDGVVVRELGLYKLKDIDRPERLFQLDIGGLASDFPSLKAEKIQPGRPFSRRPLVIGALAGVIAVGVAIPVFAFGGGSGEARAALDAAENNSLAIIAPASPRLLANPGVGGTPTGVAFGEGAYWVANADGHSVSRIDPTTNKLVDTVANVGSSPSGIAIGHGFIWVTNSLDGTVVKIDPATNTVVQTIPVGNGPAGIAYADGNVWVANTEDGTITRIDATQGVAEKRPLSIAATQLAVGAGTLWATQQAANHVVRIDPRSGAVVASIQVGNGPTGVAFGDRAAWVANSLDGTVSRVNPDTNSVVATRATGDTPSGIAVDSSGGVWVTNQGGTLRRIDAKTNALGRPIAIGNQPQAVAIADGNLLVSVDAKPGVGHRGGTLRMVSNFGPDSIDTAVGYSTASWPLLRLTNDGLVALDHASGVAGDQPVPDLAVSLPAPTDGGRTYTFRLRPSLHYSNGKPVKASDIRASFERFYRNGALPVSFYDGIVGASTCKSAPQHCDLSRGIVTDDRTRTVTFHLVAADPEFIYKLAVPSASVLPAGTPTKLPKSQPLPATGPYVIASYRPAQSIELVRNRYFHEWSRAAKPDGYPDRIEVRITPKTSTDDLVKEVTSGRADLVSTFASSSPTTAAIEAAMSQYAIQVHANPLPSTNGLFLNTRVAPFNSLDARRAVNYAIDRTAAVESAGGSSLAAPTCQVIPPGLPGYHTYCPYTGGGAASGTWAAPNLSKARALVARSGTRGMKVTVWVDNFTEATGPYVKNMLQSLGYRASVRVVQNGKDFIYFGVVGDSRRKAQIGIWGWIADYPAASDFFRGTFTCSSFRPKTPANPNLFEFCDHDVDRLIERALALELSNPQAADELWQRVDRAVVNQAPLISLYTGRSVDVVSKRVGNYVYSANGYGVLIDQLWVR